MGPKMASGRGKVVKKGKTSLPTNPKTGFQKQQPKCPNFSPETSKLMSNLSFLTNFEKVMKDSSDSLLVADDSYNALRSQFQTEKKAEVVKKDGGSYAAAGASNHQVTKQQFSANLHRAVCDADVVLEVLDARDPEGCRDKIMEETVISKGKKLVIILNKVDLVPTEKAAGWVKYLKRNYPTIPFKSMTTASRSKNATAAYNKQSALTAPKAVLENGYDALGTGELMHLLKNYSRITPEEMADIKGMKKSQAAADKPPQPTFEPAFDFGGNMEAGAYGDYQTAVQTPQSSMNMSVTATPDGENLKVHGKCQNSDDIYFKNIVVAVVGMPNVGKSSIINSLARNTSVVKTGNQAGVTRCNSRIKLTNRIDLLDTPGVIVSGVEDARAVIRGCVEKPSEPLMEEAVDLLLADDDTRKEIFDLFSIPYEVESDVVGTNPPCYKHLPPVRMGYPKRIPLLTVLAMICERRQLFSDRGMRDIPGAVRCVLEAWKQGVIKVCPEPPVREGRVEDRVAVVEFASPELDFDNL